jgi:hypothetical protein
MVKKIILCLFLIFTLALAPETSLAVPTKGVNNNKKTSLTRKSSKTSKSSKSSQASKSSRSASKEKKSYSSSRRRHRSYSRQDNDDNGSYGDLEGFTPTYYKPYKSASSYNSSPSSSSTPYKAGVVETKPLMKVIPQRDGRFLLEPLGP